MPYVYVYSPFTGQIWGKENYCNGTVHTVVASLGGCCPIDIGGDENRIVKFYGSSNVKSIKTTRVSNICASQTGYWNEGVVVDFYADYNGQCYMGRVGYGHLKDRVSNGIYNVREKELGKLPPDCSCSCLMAYTYTCSVWMEH